MSKQKVINQIKTLLNIEVKLEQMKLENGTLIEAELFEPGQEVFIVNEEERVAMPIGEYILENKMILIVVEEGVISEVKEAMPAEEVKEVEEQPELEADKVTAPKKIVESISKEMHFSEDQTNEIKKMFVEFKSELLEELKEPKKEELKEEVKLEEEAKPIVASPETEVKKKELNLYSQKRGSSIQQRVYQKIENFKINK